MSVEYTQVFSVANQREAWIRSKSFYVQPLKQVLTNLQVLVVIKYCVFVITSTYILLLL